MASILSRVRDVSGTTEARSEASQSTCSRYFSSEFHVPSCFDFCSRHSRCTMAVRGQVPVYMGGLHRAKFQAPSAAMTTSNSGMELSVGAGAMERSTGLIWLSKSLDDIMLVPLVCMEPRDDVAVMGSEAADMSLSSVKEGMGI